jgi:hypothetical protein
VVGDSAVMRQMMVLTSLRGMDSTGIAVIHDPERAPRTLKMLDGPEGLFMNQAYTKIEEFWEKSGVAVFGHGRYATKGKINVRSAHPFTHNHITLVHNGTIHFGLEQELTKADTKVDSHALCIAIAENGIQEGLRRVHGAYAVIVHDAIQKCVYVARNSERPLHSVDLVDKRIIMSEEEALEFLVTRNKLGYDPKIDYFPSEVIYRYDLKTLAWTFDDTLAEERKAKKEYAQKNTTTTTTQPASNVSVQSSGGNNPNGIEMLCVNVEALPKGGTFRYEFVDDNGVAYFAITTAEKREDRLGTMAVAYDVMTVKQKKENVTKNFVRWRELEWPEEIAQEELAAELKKDEVADIVETKPDDADLLTFYNNKTRTRKDIEKLFKKNDCALCQGPSYFNAVHQTILTDDNMLICAQCVSERKHYALGFGQ